jgi:NAD(P)-dependent dehydrogenase (short-subunit alcohol dehydrogenase family)
MANDETASLIIGASRGLGLGLAAELLRRGKRVIGTVRESKGGAGLHALTPIAEGRLEIEVVDIVDAEQIAALRGRLDGRRLDTLVVSAGIGERNATDFEQVFFRTMAVNVLGVMTAVRTISDLVVADGSIAALSSGLGSLERNTTGGMEPYRSSKAALNQSLRSFAAEHAEASWSVTALDPGWVRTDMGGPDAPLDVETSARGLADVLEARRGAQGCAFLNHRGETVPW